MFREQVLQHYREKGYALRERVKVRGASGAVHACDLVAQGPLGNLVVQFEDYGGFEGPELEAVRRIARDVGATPVVAAQDVSATVRRHAAQLGVVVLDALALSAPVVAEVQATVDREPEYPAWPDPDAPRKRARSDADDATGPSWPADGRSRPEGSPRMDPGDVDDLVSEWSRPPAPAPTRRQDPGFWKYGRDGDATAEAAAPDAPAEPASKSTPERSNSATGFSWLGGGSGLQDADVDRIDALADRTPGAPGVPGAPSALGAPGAPRTVPAERRPKAQDPAATAPAAPRSLRWLVGPLVTGGAAGAVFFGLAAFFGLL